MIKFIAGISLYCFITALSAQEIVIGTQIWSSKNLDVGTFRNGDPIPEITSLTEWRKAGEEKRPACCYYNNDAANGKTYGKIYNWYAVNDPRGLAPKGWHIPTVQEWTTLSDFLGGDDKASSKLKSTTKWGENANGTNESGFNGLPAGCRMHNGICDFLGIEASWWSSTEKDEGKAFYRNTDVMFTGFYELDHNKAYGHCVRCIKD